MKRGYASPVQVVRACMVRHVDLSSSAWQGAKTCQSHQVVCSGDQVTRELGACQPAVAGLSEVRRIYLQINAPFGASPWMRAGPACYEALLWCGVEGTDGYPAPPGEIAAQD